MDDFICRHCGNVITPTDHFCSKCGAQREPSSSFVTNPSTSQEEPRRSPLTVLILAFFFGVLGLHRIYVGKIGTGLLMLITLGGLGIWYLVDLILLVTNKFEDKKGQLIVITQKPSPCKKTLMVIGAIAAWFLIFGTSIFIFALILTNGLVSSINHQLNALKAGDIQKAYSYTSKDFQKTTSLSDFKQFINSYPSLKDNKNSFFNERRVENNNGFLKGTLTAQDGAKTPIEYQLIWEDGGWKILNIKVSTTEAGIDLNNQSLKTSPSMTPEEIKWIDYTNKNNGYSLKYPSTWESIKAGKGTVLFRGKKGTDYIHTVITIQTVLSKKFKGKYSNIQELKDDLKSQIFAGTKDPKLIAQGEIELPQNPKKFHGEYVVFTYKYKDKEYKQMYTIIPRDDGLAFYTWSYAAYLEIYDSALPIVKGMYESWIIY